MLVTWPDVADSAVKIGLGVIAGGAVTLIVEHFRRRDERQRRDEELRRSRFVDPIVAFLDDLLAAIGEVYWSHMDGREARLAEKMAFFQERQGGVEARVLALNDEQLTTLWHPFTRKVIEIRLRLGERDLGDPYETMKEAFDLGGKILRRLFQLRD